MRPARAHMGQAAATQSLLKVMATVGLTPWTEETSVLTMALGLLVANVGVRTRLSSILSHGPASAAFLSPKHPQHPTYLIEALSGANGANANLTAFKFFSTTSRLIRRMALSGEVRWLILTNGRQGGRATSMPIYGL